MAAESNDDDFHKDDKNEGVVFTVDEQQNVMIIYSHWLHCYLLHIRMPTDVFQLLLLYSIYPIHRAEFALLENKNLASIMNTKNKNDIDSLVLIKLNLLCIECTHQTKYFENKNCKTFTIMTDNRNHFKLSLFELQQSGQEMIDQCRKIKIQNVKDLVEAMRSNKIIINKEIYNAAMKCIKLNLTTQYRSSQTFNSNKDWEILANGLESELNRNLKNIYKDNKSMLAHYHWELLQLIAESFLLLKEKSKLKQYILEHLEKSKFLQFILLISTKLHCNDLECWKFVFHRIYKVFYELRDPIRCKMYGLIQTFIYNESLLDYSNLTQFEIWQKNVDPSLFDEYNESVEFSDAIRSYLHIFYCIICGISTFPIKKEWIFHLLHGVLLPLLKTDYCYLSKIANFLIPCIVAFADNDILCFSNQILISLFKHYPFHGLILKKHIFIYAMDEILIMLLWFVFDNKIYELVENSYDKQKDDVLRETNIYSFPDRIHPQQFLPQNERNDNKFDIKRKHLFLQRDIKENTILFRNVLQTIHLIIDKLLFDALDSLDTNLSSLVAGMWMSTLLPIINWMKVSHRDAIILKLGEKVKYVMKTHWNLEMKMICCQICIGYHSLYPDLLKENIEEWFDMDLFHEFMQQQNFYNSGNTVQGIEDFGIINE